LQKGWDLLIIAGRLKAEDFNLVVCAETMYHKLDESVKAHVCLVFASLAITKYIEIQTGMSHKRVVAVCSKLLTHTVVNNVTGESKEKITKLIDTDTLEDLDKLKKLL